MRRMPNLNFASRNKVIGIIFKRITLRSIDINAFDVLMSVIRLSESPCETCSYSHGFLNSDYHIMAMISTLNLGSKFWQGL